MNAIQTPNGLSDDDFEFLRRLIYEHSRISLGPEKRALVSGRLLKRLRELQMGDYAEYCHWLKSGAHPEELTQLVDAISTNHTHFFREEKHFHWLRTTMLPQWQTAHGNDEKFLAWSAASSTGEEPYTLAIELAEFFGLGGNWSIDATDISTRVLELAKQGVYEEKKVEPVPAPLLPRYFQRGVGQWEGHFRVRKQLREHIRFQHLNLLQPTYPYSQRFHLILCRNVMIYFDRPTQETLVSKLSDQLEPGGMLLVGHSESLSGIRHSLRQLHPAVYVKPVAGRKA